MEDESDIVDSINEDSNNIHTDYNNSNDGNSNYSSDSLSKDSCTNMQNTSNTKQTTDEAPNCFDVSKHEEVDQMLMYVEVCMLNNKYQVNLM